MVDKTNTLSPINEDIENTNIIDISCKWTTDKKESFTLTKTNGTQIELKPGSWITFANRQDHCIIDQIYSSCKKPNDIGPIGISYLPWRYDEKRFGSVTWSIKGPGRFIICYPSGINNYGMHIDWDNLHLLTAPDNITQDQISDIFNK
jgi:hypothetical protein